MPSKLQKRPTRDTIPPTMSPPAPPATNPQLLPTPQTTPERLERKVTFFSRFGSKSKKQQIQGQPPSPISPDHQSEEIGAGSGWKHHESYFPEYTPIYPTTTFADPYATALTPAELKAQQHAASLGRAVAIHYPLLPPFSDYATAKGQGGWQSGQWGTENWTGFGLNGERLPDTEGNTFGAPMPKGIPNPEPGKDGKKKGGDGEKGEDGGGGGEGSAGGGDGGGGGGGSGGGGGGGKNGKGKNK